MILQEIQKKTRLNKGNSTLIINAPIEYLNLLKGFNFDRQPEPHLNGNYDFVQIFGSVRNDLEQLVKSNLGAGKYDCLFWICYPKGGGRIKSDINRNVVWKIAQRIGMQCVTQIAIDETWSALRCRPIEKVGK
jgi:hypothetical protein